MSGSRELVGRYLAVAMAFCLPGWLHAQTPVPADHPQRIERGLKLFDQSLERLLTKHCLECHHGATASGGLDLSQREGLIKGGERGPAILVERPRDSLLVKLVARQHEPFMPEDGPPLTEAEIKSLVEWIDCGAPYRRPLGQPESPNAEDWTRRTIDPADREFWSFRALARPDVPAVNTLRGVKNPIDAFIIAAQAEQGLTMTAPADRRTLIRRLSLDLLGLPPTFEQVESFIDDDHPAAYQQLVDELLSHPQYGERWARHWLDLARFAESHGFEHDYDRPTAFHYRDFVVQALNANLPFDDFVRWQIAGDELAPENRLAWMATGFLAAGVHSTQITKNEVERHRYDELDDMVGTIGTAMLGLTIGCARCHDHKYDPIPQADYYRLVSAFTSTVRSEMELDFDPQRYQRERLRFDAEHARYLAALSDYEQNSLPQRLQEWINSPGAQALQPEWFSPETVAITSEAGTTFQPQSDGSWLATGPVGEQDVYTITVTSQLPRLAALRIEALSDLSLQHGGPGRAGNGNFALSNLEIVRVSQNQTVNPQPVPLSNARATFEQIGLPVAAAIDDNPHSAWAVDPQFGRHHAAVFDFAKPIVSSEPVQLVIKLSFHCNTRHSIGRLRLSFASVDQLAANNSDPFDARVYRTLQQPVTTWIESDRQHVLQWFRRQHVGWQKLDQERQAHAALAPQPQTQKVLVATEGRPAIVLHTQAAREYLDETHFLRRGDPNQKERAAAPGVLQVLYRSSNDESPAALDSWNRAVGEEGVTSGRRRAVAGWLTDTQHGAGALVARVAVNRLWQHHFGQGLVRTPSDFGQRGERPTHPELLEWLACELVDSGWDVKHLQCLLVGSAVYQSQVANSLIDESADLDNRWLTHWQPRRLEAEVLRDAILKTSGQMDDRMGGPGVLTPHARRSLYFTVKRSQLVPMLTVFDAPDGTVGVAERPQTIVAPQALWFLNDPVVRNAARQLSDQIKSLSSNPTDQVRLVYQHILQRQPQGPESELAVRFLAESPAETGLRDLCHTLYCLPEFQLWP
ncbi:DUF1549 domain-containing protein [bacterium]|nr:DUF1549 domain-containing protein [bacterium]